MAELRVSKLAMIEFAVLLICITAFAGSFFYAFKLGIIVCFVLMIINSVFWFYRCKQVFSKLELMEAPEETETSEGKDKVTFSEEEFKFALDKVAENMKKQFENVKIVENIPVRPVKNIEIPPKEPEKIEIQEEKEFI